LICSVLSHVNRLLARFRALSTASADATPTSLAALKKLKVQELREQLSAKGLSTTGLKAVLVERLAVASNLSSQSEPESATDAVAVATDAETPKRRGRPRKAAAEEVSSNNAAASSDVPVKTKAIHEDGMSLLSIEYPSSRRRRGKAVSIDDALEQSDADFLQSGTVDVAVGEEQAVDESSEIEPAKPRRRGKYTLDQLLKQEEAAEEALEVQMRARQAQRASARQQRSSAEATSEVKAFEAQLSNVADRMKPKPLSDAVWARFPPSPRGQVGVHEVLKALEAQRAAAISIYDVSGRSPLTDITIICQGSSTNHIRAIADGVARAAREASLGRAPHGILDVQGRDSDDWMLVDLQQTAVMHVFTAEGRAQYAYVEDRAVVDCTLSFFFFFFFPHQTPL
jgi:ribosome-associated protein